MQNSTLPGAFDTLRKQRLKSENFKRTLSKIKKAIKQKKQPEKTKSITKEATAAAQLANLRLTIELRKKMDAVKQNIRKSD